MGRPIAGISRLEAMASKLADSPGYVAAFVDAHRDQVFGGCIGGKWHGLRLVEQEMVIAPEDFVNGWGACRSTKLCHGFRWIRRSLLRLEALGRRARRLEKPSS